METKVADMELEVCVCAVLLCVCGWVRVVERNKH